MRDPISVTLIIILAVGLAACAGPPARHGRRPPVRRTEGPSWLARLDTDGDGRICRDEFIQAFDRLDVDGSGCIEPDERPDKTRRGSW